MLEKYNPANYSSLSKEEIAAMQDLTDDQIKELGKMYPNQPTGNAYLIYYDKSEAPGQQRYARGTWKNLAGLRALGMNNIVPFGFVGNNYQKPDLKPAKAQKIEVVDLEKDAEVEGLKKRPAPVVHPHLQKAENIEGEDHGDVQPEDEGNKKTKTKTKTKNNGSNAS